MKHLKLCQYLDELQYKKPCPEVDYKRILISLSSKRSHRGWRRLGEAERKCWVGKGWADLWFGIKQGNGSYSSTGKKKKKKKGGYSLQNESNSSNVLEWLLEYIFYWPKYLIKLHRQIPSKKSFYFLSPLGDFWD